MNVKHYLKPSSIEQAYALYVGGENRHVIAGGGWLQLTLKEADHLIDLEGLLCEQIECREDVLTFGAMTRLQRAVEHPSVQTFAGGMLVEAIGSVMSPSVRNVATFGGTVAGAYAFSDVLVALLLLDARVVLFHAGEMSLEAYLDKKREKDIVLEVKIPAATGTYAFHKVAKTHLDFGIVTIGVAYAKDGWRIVLGNRPGVAKRLKQAELLLNEGGVPLQDVVEAALLEASLGGNVRASLEYRKQVAKTYLESLIKEVEAR
jgi:probable selenate reductase FAD-binding subunit